MKTIKLQSNPEVKAVFEAYPKKVKGKMEKLRQLVLETAEEVEEITTLEETLKWGEPSYLTKKGSTLRMDWKQKSPDQYAMYFKCTSQLVPSFRTVFKDVFSFEKNRAIVFQLDDELPKTELKQCIKATLTYHNVKHLPLLGL
ncbi:DUF1801 domain-containing protein [Flagellimonas hymeniacidonis]|uniref:DUF1801 domain-containing protein n=1 Tax=Flagellimonas hymeniacidonis TaxID=2603628 RepID=A0A5C8V8C2_9FLAO|nr:DUF1801 domain-containing protein [Flagellimonas hymeniacidonis]TXN37971.1 DUF1801 domain-containing protein [Flagellimonas hymeniacidonis]